MRPKPTGDIKTIEDLLLQPYLLDPGSLEYLIEQSINYGCDGPVRIVCNIFRNSIITDTNRINVGDYIRRASLTEVVKRGFEKSLRPMGRCPKKERHLIRENIYQPERSLSFIQPVNASEKGEEILDISSLDGNLREFPEFIGRIASLSKDALNLKIKLSKFTYASALAVIAEWILAYDFARKYEMLDLPFEMDTYLKRIRFDEAIYNPKIIISPDAMDWAVGLTRINKDLPTEEVTNKIIDILNTFVNPNKSDRSALYILIAEMIENVHRHSKSKVDGFAVAQVYPDKLKMGITLVDAGIGIKESFMTGTPSVPIDHLKTDEEFLRESVKLHSTSKRNEHSGYGLYILSELIGRNRGTFLLTSGDATLVGYYKHGATKFDCYRHKYWRGTIVSVIIDLKNPLPINKIYDEMPTLPGEEDDLFIFNN